jgi:hypothetical protein
VNQIIPYKGKDILIDPRFAGEERKAPHWRSGDILLRHLVFYSTLFSMFLFGVLYLRCGKNDRSLCRFLVDAGLRRWAARRNQSLNTSMIIMASSRETGVAVPDWDRLVVEGVEGVLMRS